MLRDDEWDPRFDARPGFSGIWSNWDDENSLSLYLRVMLDDGTWRMLRVRLVRIPPAVTLSDVTANWRKKELSGGALGSDL